MNFKTNDLPSQDYPPLNRETLVVKQSPDELKSSIKDYTKSIWIKKFAFMKECCFKEPQLQVFIKFLDQSLILSTAQAPAL